MINFTPCELEVMQVLWRNGPLNPTKMQEHFPRPIHNATLRSVLLVLLEKGHIVRHKVGRSYVYEASTPEQKTFQRMVRRVSEIFCGGSPTTLIAQIIKTEKLSMDDILELQRIAEQEAEKQVDRQIEKKNRQEKGKKS